MKKTSRERIEEASLFLFSRQGFYETSTSEIASKARVSEASIYRLFKSKNELYTHILKKYGEDVVIDSYIIFSNISFENVSKDLEIIVESFFRFYFQNIHVTRIYFSNAIQFSKLIDFGSLIFPQLKEVMRNYLREMATRGFIDEKIIDSLTDIIISSVFQEVASLSIFEQLETLNENTRKELKLKWEKIIKELCKLYAWSS